MVTKIFLSLQSNLMTPNEKQSSAISRVFAVFAWSCKIAGQQQEDVFKYLEIALKFAKNDEEKRLCAYVNATLLRGYSKLSNSEDASREMLTQYFKENTNSKIHALNCLALSLLWQGKGHEAIIELENALKIESIQSESKTEIMIIAAEGDSKDRTLMNLAQAYSRTDQPKRALDYAQQALECIRILKY